MVAYESCLQIESEIKYSDHWNLTISIIESRQLGAIVWLGILGTIEPQQMFTSVVKLIICNENAVVSQQYCGVRAGRFWYL